MKLSQEDSSFTNPLQFQIGAGIREFYSVKFKVCDFKKNVAFSQYMNFSEDIWPETREKKRDKIIFGIKLNKTENEPIIVALPAFTFLQLESF